jgi:hypothetical protein
LRLEGEEYKREEEFPGVQKAREPEKRKKLRIGRQRERRRRALLTENPKQATTSLVPGVYLLEL